MNVQVCSSCGMASPGRYALNSETNRQNIISEDTSVMTPPDSVLHKESGG